MFMQIINIHAEWLTAKERSGNGAVRKWYFTTRLTVQVVDFE